MAEVRFTKPWLKDRTHHHPARRNRSTVLVKELQSLRVNIEMGKRKTRNRVTPQ